MSTVYTDTNENSTDVDGNSVDDVDGNSVDDVDDGNSVDNVDGNSVDDVDDFFEESSVKRRKMVLDCSDAEDGEATSQPMAVRKSNSFC